MTVLGQRDTSTDHDWSDVARSVADHAGPHEATHDLEGSFVSEAFDEIRRSGLLGAPVPTEFGGGGLSHREMASVLRVLGRGSGSAAVTLSMHYHSVATLIWKHRRGKGGGDTLRSIADGRLLLATSGASDWISSSGTAIPRDDGYVVTATKRPISGADAADVLVASARHVDGDQVVHFSTPMTAPGLVVDQTWDAMGLRGTGSQTVVLSDVFVPAERISLIRPLEGWPALMNTVLGAALPLIMSAYLGIADRLVDEVLSISAHRPSSDERLGALIGRRCIADDSVAAMLDASADLSFDNDRAHAASVLARKANAVEALVDMGGLALELAGGAGFGRTSPVERLVRDLHASVFHPLPTAAALAFVGSHARLTATTR